MKQSNLPTHWSLHLAREEARETLLKWLNENYVQDYYTLKASLGHSYFNFPNWNNHEGFKPGYHTGDRRYDVISLEDFKRLAFPVEELPKEYIVKCDSSEQCTEVINKYYNHNYDWNHWNYIICRQDLFNIYGTIKGNAIERYIREEYSTMPVFTFEEWSKLINNKKEEEMKDFKITGSLALQQAFINETGVAYAEGTTVESGFNTWPVLTHTEGKKTFDSNMDADNTKVLFELPKDWDKAVAFVKEWAKEEKEKDLFVPVKAGDYVMLCKSVNNWCDNMGKYVGKIVKVKEARTHSTKIQEIFFNLSGAERYQWELKNKHYRKLTKDELKELKTLKPLKLGEFTGTILTDEECVSISGRGSLSFNTCVALYNKFAPYVTPEEYEVVLNSATINIGCVKNIPVEDIISAVEYMEFMNLITL